MFSEATGSEDLSYQKFNFGPENLAILFQETKYYEVLINRNIHLIKARVQD